MIRLLYKSLRSLQLIQNAEAHVLSSGTLLVSLLSSGALLVSLLSSGALLVSLLLSQLSFVP